MSLDQARDFLPAATLAELEHGARVVRKWVARVPGLTLELVLQALSREPYRDDPQRWLGAMDEVLSLAAARPGRVGNAMRILYVGLERARMVTPALPGLHPADADGRDAVVGANAPGLSLNRPQDAAEVLHYLTKVVCLQATERQCHAFFDYWQARGWRNRDNRLIADWHAAARSWIRRDQDQPLSGRPPVRSTAETRDYSSTL